MQISLNSALSVLFFEPRDLPDKAGFVTNFSAYTKVFDADPMILPISNAPPNVPRMVLKSRDGRYVCEVSLDRLSFAFQSAGRQKLGLSDIYPEYRHVLDRVVQGTLAGISSPILRLGFVTRHIIELSEGANEWFRQNFLKSDQFSTAYETHLNLLHRLQMESFPVNRWLRIRTLRDQQNPENDAALGVEIDINTIPERGTPFDRSTILAFFLDGFDRTEKDLKSCVLNAIAPEETAE